MFKLLMTQRNSKEYVADLGKELTNKAYPEPAREVKLSDLDNFFKG